MNSFDRVAVKAHEHDLLAYARDGVRQFNWLRVIGDAPGKAAILSFEADGMHAHDLATILDREGVAVRAGHHCAQPLMERFGVASTTRASFALYNTPFRGRCAHRSARQGAQDIELGHGRFPSRALPGRDPRSLQASASFWQAGWRDQHGPGPQPTLRRPRHGAIAGRCERSHRRRHVRGQGLRHLPGQRLADDRHDRRSQRGRSRDADGRLPESREGRRGRGPGRGRPRAARRHGRRVGLPDAGQMRHPCLAHHEIGSGGRRGAKSE